MIGPLIIGYIIMFVAYVAKTSYFPPQIPLFFSLPSGEDQLGEWWMIFLFPILMGGLYMLNVFFSYHVFPKNSFAQSLIRYMNLIIIITLTFVFVRIVFLVT